jgi:uncharacterized membrane protein YqjE
VDAAPDVGRSARDVAATLVDIARTRIELAGTELAEHRLHLAQQALAATLALFCCGVGLVLAVLGLAWWAGPDRGAAVLGIGALVLLAAAVGAIVWWQRLIAERPPLLHETLAQLRADARALAPERTP